MTKEERKIALEKLDAWMYALYTDHPIQFWFLVVAIVTVLFFPPLAWLEMHSLPGQ